MTQCTRIIAFGDSTTAPRYPLQVYAERLQEHFNATNQGVEIGNAGLRGNHTGHALARLAGDVIAKNPHYVLIQFGIHDAAIDVWKSPPPTSPRVPLPSYTANLEAILRQLTRHNITPVLLTPNPLAWSPQLRRIYAHPPYATTSDRGFNILLDQYADQVRRLATAHGITCADVNHAFYAQAESDPARSLSTLLLDGIYPNDHGHELITRCVLEAINPLLHKASGQLPHASLRNQS